LTFPDDLPPEVAALFERDGSWSQTKPDIFFFTCDCERQAICRCVRNEDEDKWLRNCSTKDCAFAGEHEVSSTEVSDEESKRRKKQAKEYEEGASMLISEIEHFLGVAALVSNKDTDEAALLDAIMDNVIRKYVYVGREEAIILTLWIAHTWCLRAAEYTPYMHLRSALPREGKSRVLDVVEFVTARPLRMSDPTPAAIADQITMAAMFGYEPPTFLWDEIDSAYERWPVLREYVNNGFQRGNPIIRAKGVMKLTFAPKCMAGLTELPATVADRSFRLDMTRAKKNEKPLRLTPKQRRALKAECAGYQMQLSALAERHMETLLSAEPDLPDAIDDRGQDIAEPLLAIADVVGGEWPDKARKALVKVRNAMQKTDSLSNLELLLSDVKYVFRGKQIMYSEDIVAGLLKREESPWKTMGLNQWKLAKMLHEFVEYPGGPRIASARVRVGGRKSGNSLKAGYKRKQFEDAWSRYVK
jgi:Protein of unknown function (DUF3631)